MTAGTVTLGALALVTRAYLTDDLDGSEGDVSTVRIALEKVSYEINLTADNEARLLDKPAKPVDAATEVKPPTAGTSRTDVGVDDQHPSRQGTNPGDSPVARANGHQVSGRGRVPAAIREAFSAGHENPAGS